MIEEGPGGYSIEEEEDDILRFSCLPRLRDKGAGDFKHPTKSYQHIFEIELFQVVARVRTKLIVISHW
jgi:hypothetical protein